MSLRLIALRPEPGLSATVERARAAGLAITGHALSDIEPVAWQCPDPDDFDGLLIGSANAFLHGGPDLARLKDKPVYAVGEATADAARAAGFAVAMVGTGGLQGVIDQILAPARLLRIAGEEHVPLTSPDGVSIAEVIAYRSFALPLDPVAGALAAGNALVLLHSAATARHFAGECDRLSLDRGAIRLAALGPRIAQAAGSAWHSVHTTPRPDEAALLEMAAQLCNNPASDLASPTTGPEMQGNQIKSQNGS